MLKCSIRIFSISTTFKKQKFKFNYLNLNKIYKDNFIYLILWNHWMKSGRWIMTIPFLSFFCYANINQARNTTAFPSNVSLSLSTARSKKNGRLSFSLVFFLLNLLLYSGLSTITIKKNPSKYNKKHKK